MDPTPLVALSPLSLGVTGTAVANLQALVRRLGFNDVPPEEIKAKFYGDGTGHMVRLLQERLNLRAPNPGEVDQATAQAANESALEQGIFAVVFGSVTAADSAPAVGVTIRVGDGDNLEGLACAEVKTDVRGKYAAFYDPLFYATARPGVTKAKQAVDVVVRALDGAGVETVRSRMFRKPDSKLTVDLVVPAPALPLDPGDPADPSPTLRVRGVVVDRQGSPLPGVMVRISDRDIGTDPEPLGDPDQPTRTDDAGLFETRYQQPQFAANEGLIRGKATADLIFSLFQGEVLIDAFDIVRLPVEGDDTITVELPATPDEHIMGIVARDDELVRLVATGILGARGPSEFEALLFALRPLTARRPLVEFDEEQTRDISFAAREIGVARDMVADLVAAHRMALAPLAGTPPSVLYGLARTLGAREPRLIAIRRIEELVSGVQRSVEALVIPPFDGDLPTLVAQLHEAAVRAALALRPDGNEGALDDVLATALPDPVLRVGLLAAAVNHTGDDASFWSGFSADHPDIAVAPIQYALHLGTLTGNSVPLMAALRDELPEATSARSLAFHLDDQRLRALIASSGAMPSNVLDGESPEDARARLAGEVSGLLAASHPTAVVARLAQGWHLAAPESVEGPVVDVLARAVLKTDFDIGKGSVDDLVEKHADVLFEGMDDAATRNQAVGGVKRVQRLFQVSPDPNTLGLVASSRNAAGLPFRGALDIARYGKGSFLAQFADTPVEVRASLALMHDRSRSLSDTIANLIVGQHQDVRDVRPGAAGDIVQLGTDPPTAPDAGAPGPGPAPGVAPVLAPAAATPAVDDIPSWSDFFGGAEVCECSECRSVVGAPAYLVDLFEFLDKRCTPAANGVTPLDVLIGHPTKTVAEGAPPGIAGRRPDLANLKLSCENTNTTIPTVDLINEILESVIAFGQIVPLATDAAGEPLAPHQLSPNEPSVGVTGAELSAAPEHVLERAYRLVGQAIFPVSLPYDRLMATARVNIRQAGSERAALIRLFQSGDPDARNNAAAAETLGLLARDVEILTGAKISGGPPDAAIPSEALFGFTTGDPEWTTKLSNSRTVLRTLEISFEDLTALLRTRFVGGEVPAGDGVDVGSRLFLDVDQLKALREADFVVEAGSNTALALSRGGLSAEEVKAFVDVRVDRLATTIVLDPPTACDPDQMRLRHLDASEVSSEEWLALHRFVRLAKRMRISVQELDVALFAVAAAAAPPAFDAATLGRLSDLKDLKDLLDLSWPVTASLVAAIDSYGPSSLYDQIFISRGIDRVHPLFRRAPSGEVFATAAPIGAGTPALAAAFSLDLTHLDELVRRLGLVDLDLLGVSAIHRIVMLARALDLEPEDLIGLRDAVQEPSLVRHPGELPASLLRFVGRARALAAAGLTPSIVAYVVGADGATDEIGRAAQDLDKVIDALPALFAPLFETEDRERAEEEDRATAGQPFTSAEIDKRTADGLDRRRTAALSLLVQAFGVDPSVMSLLVEDSGVNGRDGKALVRTGAGGLDPALTAFAALVTVAERPQATIILRTLDRICVLISAMAFDAASFQLAANAGGILAPDLFGERSSRKAVADALDRMAELAALIRDTNRPAALGLAAKALSASTGADWAEEAFAAAATWLDQPVETVKAVARSSVPELNVATARRRPLEALSALRKRLVVARRIGMTADQVGAVIVEPIGTEALAHLVAGVRSHYEASTWLDVARQLSDPIRESSRDALVAFLLNRDGLKDPDQLFSRYLIDTQTNAFVLTSRIRQATFAVQIYVQRCMMGLERKNGVNPEQINVDEWKTISRFRVWGARQETLLYPEELLDPAWRDDKTKIFRDFEATIRQADVTPENAAGAYGSYLDDLRTVASLEICGTFLQLKFDGRELGLYTSVLHVIGRTRGGVPRHYFYRRLNRHENYQEWTGWEPVDADIQGVERDRPNGRTQDSGDTLYEAGAHVLPVVWRGQVHLFWPTLVRKVDVPSGEPAIDVSKTPAAKARFSLQYWELKLCWTRRQGAAWTPKEQSSALVETWWGGSVGQLSLSAKTDNLGFGHLGGLGAVVKDSPQFIDPNCLVLKGQVSGDEGLRILLVERALASTPVTRFAFSFDRAASEMAASVASDPLAGDHPGLSAADELTPSYMGFKGTRTFTVVASPAKADGDRLFTPPKPFRISTLNQFYGAPLEAPFFIGLPDRSYFASTAIGTTTAQQQVANSEPTPKVAGSAQSTLARKEMVVAVPRSAQASANPWLKADALKVAGAFASAVQSQPPSPGAKLGLQIIDIDLERRLLSSVRTIDVQTVDVAISPFFHPFAELVVSTLKRDGLDALLAPEMQRKTLQPEETFSGSCQPNVERVKTPAIEGVDFDAGSAYGGYNWELFFHAPMVVAQKLGDNKQFDAAIDVFHKVFDPLSAGSDPADAWRFEGLRTATTLRLDDLLGSLSRGDDDPIKKQMLGQIEAMRIFPFQAHRIARMRPSAYKKWATAQYVRLRLAIGDGYLRRFTPEDVNLAVQHYLIAYAVMGRRPEVIPQRVSMPAMSYAELRPNLDALGNEMFEAETKLASAGQGMPVSAADTTATGMLHRGAVGYFGIPKNEKILALWDDVADRLFKVRNGMNIDGVQIQLPLFSPRIDPALLAQAVAAGLDISDVLDALAAPRPPHRYAVMHRKAVEHADWLLSIGAALLAAREKRDAEDITRLRAHHEKEMVDLIRLVRDQQVAEAEAARAAVLAEREAPLRRWKNYHDLLGPIGIEPPGRNLKDPSTIHDGRAEPKRALSLVDAATISFESLQVIPDIAKGLAFAAGGQSGGATAALLDESAGGIQLIGGNILDEEKQEMQESFEAVRTTFDAALLDMLASVLSIIPNFEAAVKPLGAGAAVHFGGQALAAALSSKARNKHAAGAMHTFLASVHGKQAGFVLREREWITQMNQAAAEVLHVDARLAASDIQVAISKLEQTNQAKAQAHAEEMESRLTEKFTSTELYDFMTENLHRLFRRCLDIALESARMAEACYIVERDRPKTTFVRVTQSDDARQELMAGHELLACLRDMDRSWMATATRLPELVRHVSLKEVNPWALHSLRETGTAEFSIPEVLFDMGHAGHYDRRIRSIQLTMPCVAGPYAPVTGTLTLTGSRRRPQAGLAAELLEDVATGQPSISLSSGRDDGGVFELSLQDDRYLPFEGLGAISDWKLQLPEKLRLFNYRTISDVILTVRHTAKRGGELFATQVSSKIAQALDALKTPGRTNGTFQLASVRHDFPDVWYRFQAGEPLTLDLTTDLLPYVLRQGLSPKLEEVHAIRLPKGTAAAEPEALAIVRKGQAWSVGAPALGPPANLDDVYLLTRFKLA